MHALVDDPALAPFVASRSREAVTEAARQVLEAARARIRAGETDTSVSAADVARVLESELSPRLRRVLNATGIVLHTNLGRAPLAEEAVAQVVAAAGATNLELDLDTGGRGGRDAAIDRHFCAITGAERAFAVNNGAAATLLALAAIAPGREVVVSRGELVEIGGGFRIPEVLAQSGARLVEVGTTNRTRASDYAQAIGANTGAVLKVHRSNFSLVGFTEEVAVDGLRNLAKPHGIPVLYDEGTGDPASVRAALAQGAELVICSGDKLLGGPQAGLLAGRRELVEKARTHPLARALRADKLTLAALEATLVLWRTGALERIPAQRMLAETPEETRRRAQRIAAAIGACEGLRVNAAPTQAAAGGGTRPGEVLPSWGVRLEGRHEGALARALRKGDPPVIARVSGAAVWLDARTLADDDVELVARAVRAAAALGPDASEARGAACDGEATIEEG